MADLLNKTKTGKGIRDIQAYLNSLPTTEWQKAVYNQDYYQKKGIDFIYVYKGKMLPKLMTIYLFCDSSKKSDEIMIHVPTKEETDENSPLFSQADFMFYYFDELEKLKIIDLNDLRIFFSANLKQLEMKKLKEYKDGNIVEKEYFLLHSKTTDFIKEKTIARYIKEEELLR